MSEESGSVRSVGRVRDFNDIDVESVRLNVSPHGGRDESREVVDIGCRDDKAGNTQRQSLTGRNPVGIDGVVARRRLALLASKYPQSFRSERRSDVRSEPSSCNRSSLAGSDEPASIHACSSAASSSRRTEIGRLCSNTLSAYFSTGRSCKAASYASRVSRLGESPNVSVMLSPHPASWGHRTSPIFVPLIPSLPQSHQTRPPSRLGS